MKALGEMVPELAPWCWFNYGLPSHLHSGDHLLKSQQGTQQGDPLGPALFSAAIQQVVEQLAREHPLLWHVWYLDDGILVGEEHELRKVLGLLTENFRALSLDVNFGKSRIWTMQGSHAPGSPVPTPPWEEPKKVLGVPFGSEAAVRSFLEEVIKEHKALLLRLQSFPNPQVALTLLRVCLGVQKINHLLRVLWDAPSRDFAAETDAGIRRTLEEILGSGIPEASWLQSSLPVRQGGLGVLRCGTVHFAAFAASSLAEIAGIFSPSSEEVDAEASLWDCLDSMTQTLGGVAANWPAWMSTKALPARATLVDEG